MAAIVISILVVLIGKLIADTQRKKRFEDKLLTSMKQHQRALVSYYLQTRQTDQFGNVDLKNWVKKIDVFLSTQVVLDKRAFLKWRRSQAGVNAVNKVHRYIVSVVDNDGSTNPRIARSTQELSPIEYERHCGQSFVRQGWEVHYTPATADGGADFVAEKDSLRLIAQVKNYAKPVGNKAVQEAYSALRLYGGDKACVIAPRGFTAQAQREAEAHSIELLHHSEIEVFAIGLIEDR